MIQKIEDKNGLPQGWIKAKLGEVCEVLDSKRVPINSDERAKRITGKSKTALFPYYGATGLVGYIDDFLFDGEYVLLGEDGAPFLESFKDKAYLAKGKFWVNNHAHILDTLFSKTYLCHYLNQIDYREFVTGTTRLKLNQASMKEIPIILPPLPEQNRIVSKIAELFSELDKGVEALKTAQQQLKVYRQAVLKWAFEGSFTGGLENWEHTTLGSILKISSGNGLTKSTRNDDGQYLVYGGNGVTGNHSEFMFAEPQLIIGRVGVHCGNTHITKPKSWITDNAFVVYFNSNKINIHFLFYLVKNLNLNQLASSTAQPVISGSKVYPIKCKIPSIDIQQKVNQSIETRLSVADKLEEAITQSLQQAEALRQSILKKAFAGQLVPQDPNDEPASKLLERIKAEKAAQTPVNGTVKRRSARRKAASSLSAAVGKP